MLRTSGMHSRAASQKKIIILCDKGKIGTLRQCEAIAKPLAQHFNANISYVDISLPLWFRCLTPHITKYWPTKFLPTKILVEKQSLIIAAGRQAILVAAPLAKKIQTIVLLNPRCPAHYFTLVIPPQHDTIKRDANVIETLGSLHPHSETSFTIKKQQDSYTITVLLGGNSKHYVFAQSDFIKIAQYVKQKAAGKKDARVLISPSRRTPVFGMDILKHELSDINANIWDGTGQNPYFDYIGSADEILVTGDSISMISETCYLGKTVEIWKLPIKNKRFLHFYDAIVKNNHAVFAGDKWPSKFNSLRESERVLPLIISKIQF